MTALKLARDLVEAFRHVGGRPTAKRRNPWPRCPACYHRVPALCTEAEPGARPCGFGIACLCCDGPHKTPKRPEVD
mgnify:CR=1 FL=1